MKKAFTVIFGILALGFKPNKTNAQLNLLQDAYLFYPFHGDCNDYSGNFRHAIGLELTSDTGYYGVPNTCYRHNGVNSRINRPFLPLGDSCAFAGWFYSASNLQNSSLIYNGNSGSNGFGLFMKDGQGPSGKGRKIIVVQGGVSESIQDPSFNMPLNEWVHLALIKNKNTFELYINGVFRSFGTRNFNPPTNAFSIGMTPEQLAGGFQAFLGKIDDVVVYNKSISAQYIAQLFNEGFITHNKELADTKNEITIFPNPSSGKVKIEGLLLSDIMVLNALGQDVSSSFQIVNNGSEAFVENRLAQAGTYFIHFLSAKEKRPG